MFMKKIFILMFLFLFLMNFVSAEGYLEFVENPKCENNIVRFTMENVGDSAIDIRNNPVMIIRPEIYESNGIFSRYIIDPGQRTEFTSDVGEFSDAITYSLEVPESNEGSIPNVRVICHTTEDEFPTRHKVIECINGEWVDTDEEAYCRDMNDNLYISVGVVSIADPQLIQV